MGEGNHEQKFAPVTAATIRQFRVERVLSESAQNKSVVLLGTLPRRQPNANASESSGGTQREDLEISSGAGDAAILTLERLPFSAEDVGELARAMARVSTDVENDVYLAATTALDRSLVASLRDDVKVNLIYPATEAHIRKYMPQERRLVTETPEAYRTLIEPCIAAVPRSKIQWVLNILDGISEAESVIFSDPDPALGFVLVPDTKWDRVTTDSLYLLCIVRDGSLRSIRDLRAGHLGLLRHLQEAIPRAVQQRFPGVRGDQLRLFFHYPPTYFHLHVHVTHVLVGGHAAMVVGQSHLLEDVIDQIALDGEQMARRSLRYAVGVEHDFYRALSGSAPR